MNISVLIADDNVEFATTLAEIVKSFGYETILTHSPDETIAAVEANHNIIGVALLDIEYGPDTELDGLDILDNISKSYPEIPVIMISGKGTIESAVRATKLGAMNFIEKGVVTKEKIKGVLSTALERFDSTGEYKDIKNFLASQGIIADSKAMMEIGDSIIRFGRTNLNVLITGDTGTGKKLVAKAIHAASQRRRYQFVTVDIPNIPKDLFQSELFGHVKGAFSGATDSKKGLFQQANNGTIFLDEIGELTPELQSSLFIPIEEKQVRRVGSVKTEDVNLRFISATDKNLLDGMRDGKFREQLYHRLRECEIHLPNLSERREDIPSIIDHYLAKHNEDFAEQRSFAPSALELLNQQQWPGNIREIAGVIKVVLQTARRDTIEANDIHKIIKNSPSMTKPARENTYISTSGTLKADLAKVDKIKVEETLERCNGNVTKTAAILGVSRETLHNKIRRYEIEVQKYRKKKKR